MPLVGFEPTIPASERPQTYTLDRAATYILYSVLNNVIILLTLEINSQAHDHGNPPNFSAGIPNIIH